MLSTTLLGQAYISEKLEAIGVTETQFRRWKYDTRTRGTFPPEKWVETLMELPDLDPASSQR